MTEQTAFPVIWGGDVVDGPDGKKWVQVQVNGPFVSFVTMIPPDVARQLGPGLSDMLTTLADKCENKGKLVVASMSDAIRKGINNG